MPPNLPGMYWDEEKQRYFKTQPKHQAPVDAAWSKSNVQQREEARIREEKIRQDIFKKGRRITRCHALDNPIIGGRFRVETGTRRDGVATLRSQDAGGDVQASAFAQDLTYKGEVRMGWGYGPSHPEHYTDCIYVNGSDEKTGVGFLYAESSGSVKGEYLITDKMTDHLEISYPYAQRAEPVFCPEMSSIKYHEASHSIFVTSRSATLGQPMIHVFSPTLSDPTSNLPAWKLGQCNVNTAIATRGHGCAVNACAPAPPMAPTSLQAVFGTSEGLFAYGGGHQDFTSREDNEVFAVDFFNKDPTVIISAGRSRAIVLHDRRAGSLLSKDAVLRVNTAGPTAHVRSAGGSAVVAAGPGHRMALYDIRYVSRESTLRSGGSFGGQGKKPLYKSSSPSHLSRPVLTFQDYQNAAHICNIGFDILPAPGRGIVAAATDDGQVGLWSLRSGRRLVENVLDTEGRYDVVAAKIDRFPWQPKAAQPQRSKTEGVVKAIQWERLPRDENESLFVGVGQRVKKFSFGRELEEE